MDNQTSPDITIISATDTVYKINFSENGVPQAGYTGKLYFTLKKKLSDTDGQAVLQIAQSFTTDSGGNIVFSISNTQSSLPDGYYWYDFSLIVAGKVTRSFPGKCEVLQPVTEAVT
jgi:hypothetical protein